ncbi:MAG: hypothetical protein CL902_00700 [Dehalococcoidia bacterium]|nr:hypothetical protein [Dehalococcoidia bacterium]
MWVAGPLLLAACFYLLWRAFTVVPPDPHAQPFEEELRRRIGKGGVTIVRCTGKWDLVPPIVKEWLIHMLNVFAIRVQDEISNKDKIEEIARGTVKVSYRSSYRGVQLRNVSLVGTENDLTRAYDAVSKSEEPLRTWITHMEYS